MYKTIYRRNCRVANAAFEGLELLAGKPARAVLRGLGAGNSPWLLGAFNEKFMFLKKLVILVAFLFPTLAHCEQIGTLHLNPMHIELPSTWSFGNSEMPIEGKGPNGEKLLITIMKQKYKGTSTLSPEEAAAGFVNGPMVELATKNGQKVVSAVSKFPTKEGNVAFSVASESSSWLGGKKYFIQYLFSAPGAIIYFTLEGKGEAMPRMDEFNSYLATQQWD